ncbi:MAG: DUF4214 domain-containing protein [Thermoanaerobaculales bacterium]
MSQRGRAVIELGLAVAGAAAGLWLVPPRLGVRELLAAGLLAAALAWYSHRRRQTAGEAPAPPRIAAGRAWLEACLATLALVAMAALVFSFFREPYDEVRLAIVQRPPAELAIWVGRRLVFAAAQQLLLQLFLAPVCGEIVGGTVMATSLAAALFGLAHLPSPTLVVLTFVAASTWIWLYRRGRRLAPLVVAHALLWIAGFAIVPDRLTYDMRVGRAAVAVRPGFRMLDSALGRSILREVTTPSYYQRQGGTDAAFVQALYRDVLGREAAPAEVAFWKRWLQHDSRIEVAKHFVISDELQGIVRTLGDRYRFPFRR